MADETVTAANVQKGATAKTETLICGEALGIGVPVYKDAADGNKAKKGQATSTKYKVYGVTLSSTSAAGQPVEVNIEDDDFTPGFTVVVNQVYGVSATAGGICPHADYTTGDYGNIFMVGKSTSKVKLKCSEFGRGDGASA